MSSNISQCFIFYLKPDDYFQKFFEYNKCIKLNFDQQNEHKNAFGYLGENDMVHFHAFNKYLSKTHYKFLIHKFNL